eukprot:TRINITY_DN103381_c0_g1_i1.p1 TRINITY_DN103381_c0_g1~~TRINITY_DN103381_c0_g1_i1.p1  ORF type:complete len:561 (-),score=90.71 TRINITY_DN103381_c0_g1_i1:369-2051(-)
MSLSQLLLQESEPGVSRLEAGTDRSQGSEEPLLRAWDSSTALPRYNKRSSMGQCADGQASVQDCQQEWQSSRTEWASAAAGRALEVQQDHLKQKEHQRSEKIPALSNSGFSLHRVQTTLVVLQACFQMVLFQAYLMLPALHEHAVVCMVSMLLSTIAIFYWLTRQTVVMPVQQARDAVLLPFQPPADRPIKKPHEETCLSRNCTTEAIQLLSAGTRLDVMRENLEKLMPHQIIQEVVEGNICGIRVQNRDVTVMFADIRGFTRLAEVLDPDSLLLFLNRYLSVMVRVLRIYDGSVAEIHGEKLLVFWNAERDVRDHPAKAVAASVAMVQALTLLNQEMSARHLPGIEIGIGLHNGRAMTGIIGCDELLKWGCLGETVNLASRLEGLCKYYGTSVICSEHTKDSLSEAGRFRLKRLDTVKVRGRKAELDIYQVLGVDEVHMNDHLPGSSSSVQQLARKATELGLQPQISLSRSGVTAWPLSWEVTSANCSRARLYEEGLAAFQNQDFALAFAISSSLLKEQPESVASQLLQGRSASMMTRVDRGNFSEQNSMEFTGAQYHT